MPESTPLPPLERLRGELSTFMRGGDFWPLWQAVMDAASLEELPKCDEAWFDELYELVYMASPDSPTEADSQVGIIGPDQLRARIRDKGLTGAKPA